MLTNFTTIYKRLQRLKELEAMEATGATEVLPKKEVLRLGHEREKLERNLGGIRDMTRLPAAVWVVDTRKEHIAVTEARKLGIPVVAILDTNCDPDEVDYPIPGNDDAIRAGSLLTRIVADAVAEGLRLRSVYASEAAGKEGAAVSASPADEEPLAEWERELLESESGDRGRGRSLRRHRRRAAAAPPTGRRPPAGGAQGTARSGGRGTGGAGAADPVPSGAGARPGQERATAGRPPTGQRPVLAVPAPERSADADATTPSRSAAPRRPAPPAEGAAASTDSGRPPERRPPRGTGRRRPTRPGRRGDRPGPDAEADAPEAERPGHAREPRTAPGQSPRRGDAGDRRRERRRAGRRRRPEPATPTRRQDGETPAEAAEVAADPTNETRSPRVWTTRPRPGHHSSNIDEKRSDEADSAARSTTRHGDHGRSGQGPPGRHRGRNDGLQERAA
jgi:hypothetical protein